MADDPLAAEVFYADGTLRQQTAGLVRRLREQGTPEAVLGLVARPIARLAESLRRMGATDEADLVLRHAVHDGVPASTLALGISQEATPTGVLLGDPTDVTMTVHPTTGAISAGPPPPATDAASAVTAVNYLLERIS